MVDHSVAGPLHVTTDYEKHLTTQRIVDACVQAGEVADSEGVNFAR